MKKPNKPENNEDFLNSILKTTKKISRLKYNRKILAKLSELVESNPELRFGQILEGFGLYQDTGLLDVLNYSGPTVYSEFQTESKALYERIKDK